MTITELGKEIKFLGFDSEAVINKQQLISAANRALRELYNQRTITRTVKFSARGLVPTSYHEEIICKNGNEVILPLVGRCYSMRVCGKGFYAVHDGANISANQFETGLETKLVRGFISFGGYIRFWGSFSFSIYDFSVYDEFFSPRVEDIPDCVAASEYDIREMYGDFMAFVSPATDRYGNIIEGARLHDGRLQISSKFRGEVHLTYRRLPDVIIEEEEKYETDIDIPDEYLYVFPLLVASYIWLDTDSTKANYYKSRYDETLSIIDSTSYEEIDTAYVDTNGWA